MGPKPRCPIERFIEKIRGDGECWLWSGSVAGSTSRYGIFYAGRNRPKVYAHRWAYELAYGEIPEGLEVHHECRNKLCVNPDHLRLVTRLENSRLDPRRPRTHCPQGHPYDGENLAVWSNGERNGEPRKVKRCRQCKREHDRRYLADPEYREKQRARVRAWHERQRAERQRTAA